MADEQTTQTKYQFNQLIKDVHGNGYYVITEADKADTLLVTRINPRHGGMNFCTRHSIAYKNHETCELCRLQVVTQPIG